jgi:hypothetical protein
MKAAVVLLSAFDPLRKDEILTAEAQRTQRTAETSLIFLCESLRPLRWSN